MVSVQFTAALIVAAVAVTSCIVGPTTYYLTKSSATKGNDTQQQKLTVDFTDDETENGNGSNSIDAEIEEIPLKYLTEDELKDVLDAGDEIFINDVGIDMARKVVRGREGNNGTDVSGATDAGVTGGRRKRSLIKGLMSAIRALFKGTTRKPSPSVSGNRVTQQYTKKGNYQDAQNDFNELKPDDVKPFSNNGISGETGTVGNHRVTVRDGSKQGSPTLEIRTPKPKPEPETVRKIRYEDK